MYMRKRVMFFFCLLLGLAANTSLLAQETTSEIQGMVTDGKSGLRGATIVATHQPTGTVYSTTSRTDGHYNLPNLRVGGPYLIKITYVGFEAQQKDSVYLDLGQAFKGDFTLQASSTTLTEVVVAGKRSDKVFNSARTGAQEVITGGRSNQYNNVTVDGANFNNSFGLASTLGGQTGSQPISLDAIEQIQVNVAPYDVTQGSFAGTGINSVTKSGTNTFRGTVYTYLKGPETQGYRVGTSTVVKSDFSFNTRGFALGGPIVKDKLFFFVSAEQVRQTIPATSFQASDATRAPGTTNVSLANADTLTALANFLKTKYNYDPGAFQNYSFKTQSDKITAKIDWNINKNNVFTIKYNYLKSSADQFASTSRPNSAGGQITGGQPGTLSMPFYGSGYVINNNFNIIIGELNTRFSARSSNKFQVGYTALRDFRSPHSNSPSFPLVDILNNNNIYTTFGYEPFTYNNILNTDVYQLADFYKKYIGAHELTIGTQSYYRKYQNAFAPGYQGSYQFNSLSDFYASANNGTLKSRNFYQQYSALKDGSFPFAYAGSLELGFFVQDKWRVKDNFVVTYGLRADYTRYKQAFTDNPYFDALTFKDGKTYNIGQAPKSRPLFSPRFGFNWTVLDDRSLQIRGGTGVFAGPPPFVWISNQASNNGIQFGAVQTPQVFNADANAYRPAAGAPNTSYAIAITDKNFKYPSVWKSSLAFDKKFANNLVVTVEGTFSKDVNAVYYQNLNLNETNGFQLAGADNRTRYLTVANSNKYYYQGTLAQPNISSAILMANSSKGYSYTLTGRIQKTYKNFFGSLAYTLSSARNVAEGGSTASSLWSARPVAGDPNNANLAYASYYLPHRVIAFASYRIQTGKYASTSFGATFEAAPSGVTSFVYNGDLNGDGNSANDLIYIPKTQGAINLVKSGSGGLGTTPAPNDPRTPAQIWTQLNNFINQDHYLSTHRGTYARANAATLPWFKRADVNITEDLSVKTGKERHTLRLTVDIQNVGNLLNRYWGVYKTPITTNFLRYEGLAADGKTPSFSFTYQDPASQTPQTTTYRDDTSILSRWQMQFGIRYIFN
jgi:Carboxypeptidase regulatory-like domain/TonB-dependent Receptor Plug Domain